MRKIAFISILFLLTFSNTHIKAQNSNYRWCLGIYMNGINFNVNRYNVQFPALSDWQGKHQMIPSAFSVGRFISPSFNVVGTFASNKFDVWLRDEWKYMTWLRTDIFWDADASLEYKFANGYILKESSLFTPYAYAGIGIVNFNQTAYVMELIGIGTDLWVSPTLALNVHGSANIVKNSDNFLQLSAGIKYRFGHAVLRKGGCAF